MFHMSACLAAIPPDERWRWIVEHRADDDACFREALDG
jgi:hypothetical protein